jgi:hypothetical protein
VPILSVSLPPSQVGIDWYYPWKGIYPLPDHAFRPATDEPDKRSRKEPSARILNTVERYSTYRGGDTDSKDESTDSDDSKKEEEEDSLLEELESTDKDANASLQGRLIEAEKGDLARRIQQATILNTR